MGKPARTWRTSAFVYKWGFCYKVHKVQQKTDLSLKSKSKN